MIWPWTRTLAQTTFVINVQDEPFSAPTGTNDAYPAIQAAIDAAAGIASGSTPDFVSGSVTLPDYPSGTYPTRVVLPYSADGYTISQALKIPANNIEIDGGGSTLVYDGTGPAIDAATLNSSTSNPIGVYPVNVSISNLSINLTGSDAEGVRFRFSSSKMTHVGVALKGPNETGFDFPASGDAGGTGPYYNVLDQITVQGDSGNPSTQATEIGVLFTPSSTLATRAPNANTFIGGRVGECDIGWLINGDGNTLIAPTAEDCQVGFYFTNTVSTSSTTALTGCVNNSVYGGYVETSSNDHYSGYYIQTTSTDGPVDVYNGTVSSGSNFYVGYLGSSTNLFSTVTAFATATTSNRTYICPGEITAAPVTLADSGTGTAFMYPGGGGYQLALDPALASGGTPKVGLGLYDKNGSNAQIYVHYGNPEGVVSAGVGSLCLNLNGGTSATLYIKETGSTTNTGWDVCNTSTVAP